MALQASAQGGQPADQHSVLADHNLHLHDHNYINSCALFRVTVWFVPKLHTGTHYGNNIGNHMARLCRHCASASAVTMFRLTLDRVSLN